MSFLKYENSITKDLAPTRQFIDNLVDGWDGIVGNTTKYLPKEQSENDKKYNARHAKATYIDFFNQTIEGIVGLVFKKGVQYSEDIPSQLEKTIENADSQGNHSDMIIAEWFEKALQKGIHYLYVDMPKGQADNKAQETELGIRPYWTLIKAENVTSWKTEVIAGQLVLSQVKIREFVEVEDDKNPYATKTVERYRVLERGRFTVYEVGENDSEVVVDKGLTGLDFIPLVALNLDEEGFFNAKPPLYQLGKLNISHYQILSDSRYSAHVASVPFYFGAGLSDDDVKGLVISPNTFMHSHNDQADVKIVDYKGDGVAVNETLLNKFENRMREAGLSLITQDRELTATEVNITSNQSQSKLNTYVRALIDAVELALLYSAKYYNLDDGGSISIDSDILSNPLTANEVKMLSDMNMNGQMSIDTMFSIIKSGSFRMPSDFDIEVEKEKISQDGLLNGETE